MPDFRWRTQAGLKARGEAAWQEYRCAGKSCPASSVVLELRAMLVARRQQLQSRASGKK
jgi:hypothetical protein